ncbi:mitochondrial import protein Pam17-domain-containing protein [Lipomyces oligophaga]|uniref:mitochondrial import protein Pam17-domain-containing protein n=1 Tax=Lipomyces oligophaga TaxID=45792 RepID=UPI0034CEE7C5
MNFFKPSLLVSSLSKFAKISRIGSNNALVRLNSASLGPALPSTSVRFRSCLAVGPSATSSVIAKSILGCLAGPMKCSTSSEVSYNAASPARSGFAIKNSSTRRFSTRSIVFQESIPNSAPASQGQATLSWDEFLSYRTYRRVIQLSSMGLGAVAGIFIGWGVFATIEIDPTQMIFGFDPLLVLSGGLIICGLVGALLGPLFGNFVFQFFILRSKRSLFRVKEDLFLQHIKRNRVDPSFQSFGNPVPDYYGEKITSLHGYRSWLRSCAAYRKKHTEFIKL